MFHFLKKKESQPQLPYSTEVHCHILPGIDDGAQTIEEAVALAHMLCEWGVKHIIATPHVTEMTFENDRETIGTAYRKLTQEGLFDKWGLSLNYSAEYRMDAYFEKIMEHNGIIAMPHRHVLIESSFLQPYWGIKELIFKLQNDNYTPILAHPERYPFYQKEKQVYKELHERGCEFQVNLLSLAGCYTRQAKEVAEWLIDKRMVDYLGSDLHNHRQAEAINNYLTKKEFAKHRQTLHLKNDTLI